MQRRSSMKLRRPRVMCAPEPSEPRFGSQSVDRSGIVYSVCIGQPGTLGSRCAGNVARWVWWTSLFSFARTTSLMC